MTRTSASDATREGRLVAEVLEDFGRLTRDALIAWLPKSEPRAYLYDLMADYPSRGGRMMRPSLCIATARVFGGEIDDVMPAACSIELLHNALLIHDDIEDESDERRGRPTLHKTAGTALAINAGDALAMMSLRPLIQAGGRLGSDIALQLFAEFDRMARETAEGQALDLGWRRDNVLDLTAANYLEMVLKKTCWLTTIFPLRVGALLGTHGEAEPEDFLRFGFFVGAAFQIQDDLLNLVGDHEDYGKEMSGDLWEGKRTLMLIHLLEHATDDERRQIGEILDTDREGRDPDSIRWLRERMDAHGSIEHGQELAHGLAGAAQHEFELLFGDLPESREKRFLEALPKWVLERA